MHIFSEPSMLAFLHRMAYVVEFVNRKVNYKLYPNNSQLLFLEKIFNYHRHLYNSLLEQRIWIWQSHKKSISYADQCKQITLLRKEMPEFKNLNAQSLQETAKRLDRAFQSFFKRVQAGQTPGFPRFKSYDRFSGWSYKTHGDGWRLDTSRAKKVTCKNKTRGGVVRISGIGTIPIRGMSRNGGEPKTMQVVKKADGWYISVTYACVPERLAGEKIHAFDWGIENFLTLADESEKIQVIENPRFLKSASQKLETIQKDLSRKKLKSCSRKKVKKRLARFHQKIARKRVDFMHKKSCHLVEISNKLITEQLTIKNITRAPQAKMDEVTGEYLPNGAASKAGLNKSILDTSPTQFLNMVRVKAEEAGYELEELDTKKLKPSQRCAQCSNILKKELGERQHSCSCGFKTSRDANSALVMLRYALGVLKIEPTVARPRSRGPTLCEKAPTGA